VISKRGVPPVSWTPERLARLGQAGGWCACQSEGSTARRIRPRSVVTRSSWSGRVAVRSGSSRASSACRMSRSGCGQAVGDRRRRPRGSEQRRA
jgi:hypothetical protein